MHRRLERKYQNVNSVWAISWFPSFSFFHIFQKKKKLKHI